MKIFNIMIIMIMAACTYDRNNSKVQQLINGDILFTSQVTLNSRDQAGLPNKSIIAHCRNYNGGTPIILDPLKILLHNSNIKYQAISNKNIYYRCH